MDRAQKRARLGKCVGQHFWALDFLLLFYQEKSKEETDLP